MNSDSAFAGLFQQSPFNPSNFFTVDGNDLFSKAFDISSISQASATPYDSMDEQLIQQFSKNIIGGFLNLGESDGWPEGHDNKVGAAFTRFILKKYYAEGKSQLGKYKPVFEKAIEAFRETGQMIVSPFSREVEDGHRPKNNRVAYDCAVTGWQKHTVCRMVGNIASQYGPTKPFFEILVNSQRTSYNDPACQPFYITIHNNEGGLDKRRQLLASLETAPSLLVHPIFYSDDLVKPEKFLETYKDKIGPNSTRILKGLAFLQDTTIKAQTVGNCWIKQPIRCLLATLYLELLSTETKLTPKETWDMAKSLYLCVQRATAIPYIESMLQKEKVSPQMLKSAKIALEKRKAL